MTYCVGVLLRAGLVCASDSRTNAGVDNVSSFRKMKVFERRGDRVLVVGLGLIGQLTVRLLRAHGCAVVGVDPEPVKCAEARRAGAEAFASLEAAAQAGAGPRVVEYLQGQGLLVVAWVQAVDNVSFTIKAGETLATTGGAGKTIRCAICHGADLKGLGNVPPLAGRAAGRVGNCFARANRRSSRRCRCHRRPHCVFVRSHALSDCGR